ncbi:MAG: hypothetical protein KDD37_00440 [Bdellovibrionales bacterium]|nr:hypothetical protein [Bdellovibrionales bacterium]
MIKTLGYTLIFITSVALADSIESCRLLFDVGQPVAESDYIAYLNKPQMLEWNDAKKIFSDNKINYRLVQSKKDSIPFAVISPEGSHSANILAKKILEKYGAKLIYETGSQYATFSKDLDAEGRVQNMYISLPLEMFNLPFSILRTYAVLHEARHMVDFVNAYNGVDLPYYGAFYTEDGSAVPTRPGMKKDTGWLAAVKGRFFKQAKEKEREFVNGVYNEISVDELRSFFSTVYQQALRLSTRLKQGDMSKFEMSERLDGLQFDIETLHFISKKLHYNLSAVLQTLSGSGYHIVITESSYNGRVLYIGNLKYNIDGKDVYYQVQLPGLPNKDSMTARYKAIERQARWSLDVAEALEHISDRLNSLRSPTTNLELRAYLDTVLEAINPQVRREWENSPAN